MSLLFACLMIANATEIIAKPGKRTAKNNDETETRRRQNEDEQAEDSQKEMGTDESLGLKFARLRNACSRWLDYLKIKSDSSVDNDTKERLRNDFQRARQDFANTPTPLIVNSAMAAGGLASMVGGFKKPGPLKRAFLWAVIPYTMCSGLVSQVWGDYDTETQKSADYVRRELEKVQAERFKKAKEKYEKALDKKQKEFDERNKERDEEVEEAEERLAKDKKELEADYEKRKEKLDEEMAQLRENYEKQQESALEELREVNKREAEKQRKRLEAKNKKGWF